MCDALTPAAIVAQRIADLLDFHRDDDADQDPRPVDLVERMFDGSSEALLVTLEGGAQLVVTVRTAPPATIDGRPI